MRAPRKAKQNKNTGITLNDLGKTFYRRERETHRNLFYLRGTYAATYAEQVSLTRGHDQKLAGSRHRTYAATFFHLRGMF